MEIRKNICVWLFEKSTIPYARLFKRGKTPWRLSKKDLLRFPKGTLGNALGTFLNHNNFELIPKLERHDAYHVITNYGTEVENEIALQYFFFGNGKRSLYLYGVSTIGLILLPEYWRKYIASYSQGKRCKPIHKIDVEASLSLPLDQLQSIHLIH